MALYEAAHPQFERLKGIKSLGLMAYVHDIAIHTRHQHLVGLMRIFNKLCQQPKEKGLPKAFLWSFWCRLCFGQTGHAALSYDSEKAVLLACHLDSNCKAALRSLVQPVIDKLASCLKCERKTCDARAKGNDEGEVWFDNMVMRNRWRQLHFWVAALKLLQEPKILPILSQQLVSERNTLGFSQTEAVKMLVAPGCEWDRALNNLCRLDHVVRDFAFAGTLGIQLDVDNLVSSANDAHADWKLLGSLNSYLVDTLYESIPAQTVSVLYQRALANLLVSGKISLDVLFGIDLNEGIQDDDLKTLVGQQKAGREVFDADRRKSWRTWRINTYLDKQCLPCEVERQVTGHRKGFLTRHTSSRATCFKLQRDHNLAITICHRDLADRPQAKVFVKLCRSVLSRQYPKLISEQLTAALFEGLVARKCQHGLRSASERLGRLNLQLSTLQRVADIVNKNASRRSEVSGDLSFKIGGYEYPFRGDPQELQINTMHAALLGDDAVRNNLGVTVQGVAELLWDELLDWQSVYFGSRTPQKVLALIDEAQDRLSQQVVTVESTAGADLELYALLEALKHPHEHISFRVALPNLRLLKDDGTTENEYDVVSVVLKKDKDVEVWVWEVTTEQKLAPKRSADFTKIQKIKDLLGNRWEGDVRVVTCYIHREGNEICCEIDGRQQRRSSPYDD